MRHLLILTCLLFGTGAVADEADFDFKSKKANIAIEKYQATIKKAKAVEKRNRVDLILTLEAALKYERTEGELDEAIKIRDAIKALKKGASPAGGSAAGSTGTKRKARIPADAVKWNGHHYKVYAGGVPHSVAQKQCEMMGGHLARIQNPGEQRLLTRLIANGKRDGYWLDGSDVEKEGLWKFSDGSPMKYFAWGAIEPNNGYGRSGGQNALRCFKDGSWDDESGGSRRFGFICEWDAPADGTVQANRILNKPVKFVGSLGGTRKMILSPDGRILWPNGDGHENESFWKFDDNRRLVLLNKGGDPSCVMAMIHMDDGKVRFCGPYLFGPNIYHTVEEISVPP